MTDTDIGWLLYQQAIIVLTDNPKGSIFIATSSNYGLTYLNIFVYKKSCNIPTDLYSRIYCLYKS